MAKDPRFNFYPDNWDGGTEDFTLEQEGAYLRLIIMQSRKGKFTAEQAKDTLMRKTRGNAAASAKLWNFLMPKFITDGTSYWSERLDKELAKSRSHSEKQRERAEKRWSNKNGTATAYTNTQALPVNGIGIGNGIGIEVKGKEVQEENQFDQLAHQLRQECDRALDERTIENIKLSHAYPGVDIDRELQRFKLKVAASPRVYADHGTEGLRLAFNAQLRSAKPESEAKPKHRVKSFELEIP